ncbi:coatomer subunit zeta [Nematocida homosporus]|uniref:coatomer subunit zeta n=1 Tax=Nematocida homosporus TaxID=1912981 RepID=UPI00221F93E1|nr:coatomer subunit zeta [Nematocida homosporus]KAI5184567.1 coatomer subunit zeta [Nematocida homosporus]
MSSLEIVYGLAIIGEGGIRLLGTPLSISAETKELEVKMFNKAKETEGNILLFDSHLVLYKAVEDVYLLLYAPITENEIMLFNALDAFYSAIVKAIKGPLTQKSLTKHYDEVFLVLDSFIYKNVLISDSTTDIVERIPKRTFEGLEAMPIPSKFSSAFKKAQKSFASSWFKK